MSNNMNATGSKNTMIGDRAEYSNLITGSNNTFLDITPTQQ